MILNNKLFEKIVGGLKKEKKILNDKNVNVSKLEAFAEIVLKRVESSAGKGENAACQHYVLFPHCF